MTMMREKNETEEKESFGMNPGSRKIFFQLLLQSMFSKSSKLFLDLVFGEWLWWSVGLISAMNEKMKTFCNLPPFIDQFKVLKTAFEKKMREEKITLA